jgi:hypothetical protein
MVRLLIIFSILTVSFSSCLSFGEPHSLKYKPSFNEVANEIVSQKTIFEMDDFTRDYKSINGVWIYLGDKPDPKDTLACRGTDRCPKPLNMILDSFHIDRKVFESIQNKLRETKLRSFQKSGDSVLFIVDGLLDDAWGFLYSTRSLGSKERDFKLGAYHVHLGDSINKNWRQVGIGIH